MALFRGIQEYIALDANNITLVFDWGNIVNISGNTFLYPPQGHPILYNCSWKQLSAQIDGPLCPAEGDQTAQKQHIGACL